MDSEISTVWLFRDGKRGHENQVLGLAEAFERRRNSRIESVLLPHEESLAARWGRLRDALRTLPRPSLLLGAGHATHLALLWAARRCRAPSVVLMQPSLPGFLFDFVVAPRHDLAAGGDGGFGKRYLATRGAINRVRYDPVRKERLGLILVGGPSREHGWNPDELSEAIRAVVASEPDRRWVLTNSRRTPPGFAERLRTGEPAVECREATETGPDWLPDQLARAETVWVTRDSVSMIYEALTAGARVGLLDVPLRGKPGKLTRGVEELVREGWATPWERWRENRKLPAPPEVLNEADRIAEELEKRLGWV